MAIILMQEQAMKLIPVDTFHCPTQARPNLFAGD